MSDSGRSEIEEWISRWNDGYQGGMSIRTASEDARAESKYQIEGYLFRSLNPQRSRTSKN